MGKEIGCSFKYNRSKISTPTLKKPILSSSSAHTLCSSNSTRTLISYQLDNKDSTPNQNKNNTSNTDDIHSCGTPQKQNYSVKATSTPPSLTPLNTTLPITPVEFHKIKQLPPSGKKYLCFHTSSKYSHADQCVKSQILNNAINYILSIDTFKQKCVVIKCMLQSLLLDIT